MPAMPAKPMKAKAKAKAHVKVKKAPTRANKNAPVPVWTERRRVRPSGPESASLLICAEAPGRNEHFERVPLVGASGHLLDELLADPEIDLPRAEIRLENTFPYWPGPGVRFPQDIPEHILETEKLALLKRIAYMPNLRFIITLGKPALCALAHLPMKTTSLETYRGSLLHHLDLNNRRIPLIPTYHPSATFKRRILEKHLRLDLVRAARFYRQVMAGAEIRAPVRRHTTHPSVDDIERFLTRVAQLKGSEEHPEFLAVDIETPWKDGVLEEKDRTVLCIGFSFRPDRSLVVPTVARYWGSKRRLAHVWRLVREILDTDVDKSLQRGVFDTYVLDVLHGIRLRNWRWDTLDMHRCLDPVDIHNLQYLASVDSLEPTWKEKKRRSYDELLVYNGRDACVQRELTGVYYQRLRERGLLEAYRTLHHDHFQCVIPGSKAKSEPITVHPCLELSKHGFYVNRLKVNARRARALQDRATLWNQLERMSQSTLRAKVKLSGDKLAEWLFSPPPDGLGLTPQEYTNTGKPAMNELAYRLLAHEYKGTPQEALVTRITSLCLEEAKTITQIKQLEPSLFDADSRFRAEFAPRTYSLRYTSTKNAFGSGDNLQNRDHSLRDVFEADISPDDDDPCALVQVDLKGAEDKVVRALTRDPREIAKANDLEFDPHREGAAICYDIPEEDVTPERREGSKRIRHGFNYGEQERRVWLTAMEQGDPLELDFVKAAYARLKAKSGAILEWQDNTWAYVGEHRHLTNTWGQVVYFTHHRLDYKTRNECLAWRPQSEIATLMNQWGFLPLQRKVFAYGLKSRVNAHMHDGLVISMRVSEAEEIIKFLIASLVRPRVFYGNALTIDLDIKVGTDWAFTGATKFKSGLRLDVKAFLKAVRDHAFTLHAKRKELGLVRVS